MRGRGRLRRPPPASRTISGRRALNLIWREGDQYIALAMPIDVASAGTSPEQARKALDEAVGLFLSVAREQGTLHDILEEYSYEFRDGSWCAPECVASSRRGCAGTSHDLT